MAQRDWKSNFVGLWRTSGNWFQGFVPTSVDDAAIFDGTATIDLAANAQSVTLYNAAILNAQANLTVGGLINVGAGGAGTAAFNVSAGVTQAGSLSLGESGGNSGRVTVSGGTLNAPTIIVGTAGFGTGTLNVLTGGAINASGGITVAASGQVVVGGVSTAAAAGTLTGNMSLSAGTSALLFRTTNAASYGGIISGSGTVTQNSAGQTATLTGANTYSGLTTITAGTLQIGNGGATGSLGSGGVANSGTLAFNHSAGSYTTSNLISGTGAVNINGAGSEVFTANNTYSGTTTIGSTAQLVIGNNGTSGSLGTGTVTLNGALVYNRSNDGTFANTISGSGSLTKQNSGTLILTANNSYGATNISGGTLQIGNSGSTGSLGSGAVALSNGATLALQHGAGQYNTSNAISGNGSLVQRGASIEVLLGNNTYSGTTTINGGTVAVGLFSAQGTLGTGNVILQNSGFLDLIRNDLQTISNTITGSGNVRVYGNHTAVLTGSNTYSGATTVFASNTLQIGNGGTTGSLGISNAANDGTLVFRRSDNISLSNAISGAGTVRKELGNVLTLAGTNTYTGSTQVAGGTLKGGIANAFGNGSGMDVATGTILDIGGFNQTIGNLTGGGTIDNTGSDNIADTLTINNTANTTFSGVIQDTGDNLNLVKNGGGTLTLSGNNSFAGKTTINAGTLEVSGGGALNDTSEVAVGAAATFRLNTDEDIGALSSSAANASVETGAAELSILGNLNTVYAGTIAGTGAFLNDGTAKLELTGDSSGFTGLIGATGSGSEIAITGAGQISAFGVGSTSGNTFSTDGGAILASDAILIVDGQAVFSGSETIGSITDAAGTGLANGSISLSGATTTLTVTGAANVNNPSNTNGINGVISGDGSFAVTGGTLTLAGANTYSGTTTVTGGTLDVTGSIASASNTVNGGGSLKVDGASLADSASVTLIGTGNLTLTGNETIGALSSASVGSTVSLGLNGLTTGNAADQTFAGVISGTSVQSDAFTKVGTGTLTLTGANTYTGITNIFGGTLVAGHADALSDYIRLYETGSILNLGGNTVTATGVIVYDGLSVTEH